jgi:hypothetical protein
LVGVLVNPALIAVFDRLLNPDELLTNVLENGSLSLLGDLHLNLPTLTMLSHSFWNWIP